MRYFFGVVIICLAIADLWLVWGKLLREEFSKTVGEVKYDIGTNPAIRQYPCMFVGGIVVYESVIVPAFAFWGFFHDYGWYTLGVIALDFVATLLTFKANHRLGELLRQCDAIAVSMTISSRGPVTFKTAEDLGVPNFWAYPGGIAFGLCVVLLRMLANAGVLYLVFQVFFS